MSTIVVKEAHRGGALLKSVGEFDTNTVAPLRRILGDLLAVYPKVVDVAGVTSSESLCATAPTLHYAAFLCKVRVEVLAEARRLLARRTAEQERASVALSEGPRPYVSTRG